MNDILRPSGNAVLMRELRASLRNARPFALIALYVAVLGSIVVSQFPANSEITIETGKTHQGTDLYWTFVIAQAALIFLVLPAIASGALSQEREQRTLEPLLLTPLTPLQIVWGKAVGVLSLGGLLLLSTLPLTSLCFLLGGVSPGELAAAYIILLGLALFTSSIGLYCSAKWTNSVRATLVCYLLLPFSLLFLVLFAGTGVIVSALAMIGFVFHLVVRIWNAWGKRKKGDKPSLSQRLGTLWTVLGWLAVFALAILLFIFMAREQNFNAVAFGAFGLGYLLFISQIALQQAAREIIRAPEPTTPARQRMQDFREEWQQAMATPAPYLPDPMLLDSQREAQRQQYEKERQAIEAENRLAEAINPPAPIDKVDKEKATYGKVPFLSDRLNPIFAKDLRSGLLGKFEYLLRFSYIAVIGSELLLMFLAVASPVMPVGEEWYWFRTWAITHTVALLAAGAWLGARSIAPEHEQQTLAQLIMTPLRPDQIVGGKIQAVMTYTFYLFMLALPMSLLLAALKVVTWPAALGFIVTELVFGAVAAAWGMFCSLKTASTRRALAFSLGGVFVMTTSALLFDEFVQSGLRLVIGRDLLTPIQAKVLGAIASPLNLLSMILDHSAFISAISVTGANQVATPVIPVLAIFFIALGLWGLVALGLFWLTIRGFRHYADTI